MLILHQAINVPGMESVLICPNQLRDNDVQINDEPKHMVLNPTERHHAIIVPPRQGDIDEQDETNIIRVDSSIYFILIKNKDCLKF